MAVHYRRPENLTAGTLKIDHKHANKVVFHISFPVWGKKTPKLKNSRLVEYICLTENGGKYNSCK